jgi:hypothetical protein
MIVERNSEVYVLDNFKSKEFFTKSADFLDNEHFFSDKVATAIQAVRSFIGKKVRVTSTLRTSLHNSLIGGGKLSQHLTGNAGDFEFIEDEAGSMRIFYEQMLCKGELYQSLKNIGIKGVGIYKGFIHLDDGDSELNKRSIMTFWDFSDGQHGEVEINTSYMNSVAEEGSTFCNGEEVDEGSISEQVKDEKKNFLQRLTRADSEDGIKSRKKEIVLLASISAILAVIAYLYLRVKSR